MSSSMTNLKNYVQKSGENLTKTNKKNIFLKTTATTMYKRARKRVNLESFQLQIACFRISKQFVINVASCLINFGFFDMNNIIKGDFLSSHVIFHSLKNFFLTIL